MGIQLVLGQPVVTRLTLLRDGVERVLATICERWESTRGGSAATKLDAHWLRRGLRVTLKLG